MRLPGPIEHLLEVFSDMRQSTNFTFDGISSEDMGVHAIQTGNGLFKETFLPQRVIVETRIGGRDKPYHQRVELLPLSFNLNIFIEEWKQRDNLRQIARWLNQDYYKPFFFNDNPDRIAYAMVDGSSSLYHNGMREGYVTLNIKCNSPYTYSPLQTHELSTSESDSYQIFNEGDLSVKPVIWITKTKSDGGISIVNSTTDQIMALNNLKKDEEIFIDFENYQIESSLESLGVYRHDDHNDVWLELAMNENSLKLTGDFEAKIEYQAQYLY